MQNGAGGKELLGENKSEWNEHQHFFFKKVSEKNYEDASLIINIAYPFIN